MYVHVQPNFFHSLQCNINIEIEKLNAMVVKSGGKFEFRHSIRRRVFFLFTKFWRAFFLYRALMSHLDSRHDRRVKKLRLDNRQATFETSPLTWAETTRGQCYKTKPFRKNVIACLVKYLYPILRLRLTTLAL
jgi:hypothetical protein